MQISLNLANLEQSARLREEIEALIRRSFAKFADTILTVKLTLTDVNGPKGGIDKHCRAVISLRGLPPIIVDHMDSKSNRAMRRVLSRASANVRERINRRSRRVCSRRMNGADIG